MLGYKSPNEKLNIASIGAGGKAASDIHACAHTENIVALCDVDENRAKKIFTEYEQVPKYKDFRVMLDKEEKNIDAVIEVAVMLVARTNTGSSTHGGLYELDAIAAVVIGGTLLSGGRGTIVGTVFGVLILNTLTNVFTLNNQDTSTQAVAKGVIIVVAVLLQQRLARRSSA